MKRLVYCTNYSSEIPFVSKLYKMEQLMFDSIKKNLAVDIKKIYFIFDQSTS